MYKVTHTNIVLVTEMHFPDNVDCVINLGYLQIIYILHQNATNLNMAKLKE